jgi:hypothetical protein
MKTHHKSKPPLRWFVNGVLHRISMYYFTKGLIISEKYDNQMTPRQYKKLNRFYRFYRIFDKPYQRWGTTYSLDKLDFAEMVDREDL